MRRLRAPPRAGWRRLRGALYELTKTVTEKKWETIQEQLEGAVVHVLAVAGILGIELRGVVAYTAYNHDKLSREGALDPALLKLPVDPAGAENARRWAQARRSWERGRVRMNVLGKDVEHIPIAAGDAPRVAVACRRRAAAGETRWVFELGT